ncbi:MAG: toprim domain-containing protein [Acutalibacteraceae bacterium]
MLKIKEAIIVEGRYDKIKLSSIIDAPIIETSGFRIFKDKEKQNLIREIARTRGILVFTDSDGAGFVIRSFLRGAVEPSLIKHAYIPMIHGKEKRKQQPSKEGLLGVEGVSDNDIIDAIRKSGATIIGETAQVTANDITKQDLYELGLSGRDNSAQLRTRLLNELNMPTYITANAMLTMLNCLLTKSELEAVIFNIKEKSTNNA